MSTMGIEAIGGALAAMPTTPTMDFLSDAQPISDGTQALTGAASALGGVADVSGVSGVGGVSGISGVGGGEFGSLLASGIDRLEGLQNTSSNLSVQAATGDLDAIHDYTIAAAEASTATQLTVALRNTALQSFNSIMNMSV